MAVNSLESLLCLCVRIREGENGNEDSLFNFIARSIGLKKEEAINFLKKMKDDPALSFEKTMQVDVAFFL